MPPVTPTLAGDTSCIGLDPSPLLGRRPPSGVVCSRGRHVRRAPAVWRPRARTPHPALPLPSLRLRPLGPSPLPLPVCRVLTLCPTARPSPQPPPHTPFRGPALNVCAFACAHHFCALCALVGLPSPSPCPPCAHPMPHSSPQPLPLPLGVVAPVAGCRFEAARARTRPAASSSALLEWRERRARTHTAHSCE
jgi:hypothetical protein